MDIQLLTEQLSNTYIGQNSVMSIFTAFTVFVGLLIILKIIQRVLIGRLRALSQRTKTLFDNTLIEIIDNIRPPFYFLASLYVAIRLLFLPELLDQIVTIFVIVSLIYETIQAADQIVGYGLKTWVQKQPEQQHEQYSSMTHLIQIVFKVLLWAVGLLLLLGNIGIDVTSLIASLGIGGLAVALALQNVLSDLFSSFSIYIDKPFTIGDFIQVGDHFGSVQKIGLKTTRLLSLKGEELIISNKELTSARIHNYKRLEKRRETMVLGVTYETDIVKLQQIPEIIKNAIQQADLTEFDRCHFSRFGDSALEYEIVFFVDTQDYNTFMDCKQKINYSILKSFSQAGIDFAYPTQTIQLQK